MHVLPVFSLPLLYLDPGSGSLIIQLVLALVLGAGVAVKIFWGRIKTLFTGKQPEAQPMAKEDDGD